MRILALNYEYPPLGGGGGVVFQQIVEALAQRHEVTVVTSQCKDLPAHERTGGLSIHRVRVLGRTARSTATLVSMLSYFPSSLRFGTRLLRHSTFDVINAHFAVPTAPSAQRLARRFGIPHVLSVHGGDLYDPSKRLSPHRVPGLRSVVRRLLVAADRVVAQSTNTADNVRKFYGVDRPVDLIPLGIRPPAFTPARRCDFGIGEDRFVLATVGRLIARKGLEDLVEVVAKLDDPKDLLLVIGDGPQRAQLENLARTLGVAERVRFTGFVDELEKWRMLSVADLYASTSLHEGFGLVFLEAMHCGLPVVCYDNGGQTDFLVDGKTGALVPAGRSDTFIEAVNKLKRSPQLREACATGNRECVRNYYIDVCASRYEALFEDVVRQAR